MSTRTTRQSSRTTGPTLDLSTQRDNKENVKTAGAAGKFKTTKKNPQKYCLCQKPDDGSPMIYCSNCDDWYHFRCVELSEQDAEEIRAYVCPPCQEKTGARSIREWEEPDIGPETGEAIDASNASSSSAGKSKPSTLRSKTEPSMEEQDDSGVSSDGSDEYIPETAGAPKSRVRRQSYHSDVDMNSDTSRANSPKRLRRGSTVPEEPTQKQPSPADSSQPKRKHTTITSAHPPPPPKRPRSESTAGEDAARKYCLIKLQELFCQIFTRYPFLPRDTADARPLTPDKKTEELTLEEKEQLELRAKQFGIDLEQSMYELYSEPDKKGKPVVAGKYKERFRMLTFNLSKADRVILHMRISSSRISPKELSTMSSTDLASEEEKQSIKKLEEEALAQSILKKSFVPRAKLTHKGLQDIEDMTGTARRDAEREEEEEDERIERERLARLRLQAQRPQLQGSAPPESPVVTQPPSWGAPPPVPIHAVDTSSASRPPAHPLFIPSSSDSFLGSSMDIELNLTDLINIDEESSGEVAMTPIDAMPSPFGETQPTLSESSSVEQVSQPTPSPIAPTHAAGISPFAANVSSSSRSVFDLNALWTPTESESRPANAQTEAEQQESSVPVAGQQPMETDLLDADSAEQDFDMFLNNEQEPAEDKPPTPEPMEMSSEEKRATFDAQPLVWNGTLSMPLDSAIPQEVAVVARQLGGRSLSSDSPLWQTLFPLKELRIDGRVPVEKSAHYLTQIRMNPGKELIAVAFSPTPSFEVAGFHAVKNHLLSKGRHGLAFPWGHNPKASAPGREFYIVPLLASEPIPEYMELLDELQLPPQRDIDYLVGVWVLTKGKLAPPPQPVFAQVPAPVLAPATTVATVPPLPKIDFAQLSQLQQLIPPSTQSRSPPRPLPLLLQSQSPPGGAAAAVPVPNPAPNPNLTAEVASLTPQQIQLMLQTLTKATQAPSYPYSPPHLPGPLPPPERIAPPTASLPTWSSAPAYPPPPQAAPPYPGSHSPPRHSPPRPSYNDSYSRDGPYNDHNHNSNSNGNSNNGYGHERGYRGRGGRGRGDRARGQHWQKGSSRSRGPPTGPRNRGGSGWAAQDQHQRWT